MGGYFFGYKMRSLTVVVIASACLLVLVSCSSADSSPQREAAGVASETTSTTSGVSTTSIANTTTTTVSDTTTTTTTTTTVFSPESVQGDDLTELAARVFNPIVNYDSEYVSAQEAGRDLDADFEVVRSVDGETWTTEPISGWPESASLVVALAETDEGLAVLTETRFDRAALLTTTDLVNWQRESIPDLPGRPRTLAVSEGRLVFALVDQAESVTIVSGPIGGPFTGGTLPFELGSRGQLVALDQGALLLTADKLVVFVPWADLSAWMVVSPGLPAGTPIEVFGVAVDADGILYAASASSLWESADLGETWTESAIPTDLVEIDAANIFRSDAAVVVELGVDGRIDRSTGVTRALRTREVWHLPNSGEWTLLQTWENPANAFEYPEGVTTDAWPSVQALNEESLSFRWDVLEFANSGSDLASQSPHGAFLQKLPVS